MIPVAGSNSLGFDGFSGHKKRGLKRQDRIQAFDENLWTEGGRRANEERRGHSGKSNQRGVSGGKPGPFHQWLP